MISDIETVETKQDSSMVKFIDPLTSSASLDHYWRVAKLFSESSFVPEHFRKKPGDCLIALSMALEMNENPLMLMQQSFMIHGRPGWSTQYMIARANNSGAFSTRINWETHELEPKTIKHGGSEYRNIRVVSFVKDQHGDRLEAEVTTQMAIDEGWTKSDKYKSMLVHMLRYRSAAFLIRQFAPEVMMGMSTVEELATMPAEAVSVTVEDILKEEPKPAIELADLVVDADQDWVHETDPNGRKILRAQPQPKKLTAAKVKDIEHRMRAGEKMMPADVHAEILERFGKPLAELPEYLEADIEAVLELCGVK